MTPTCDNRTPLWERQVYVGHCWARDVEAGDGPVYITFVGPWLDTLAGIKFSCPACTIALDIVDGDDVTGYRVAHEQHCRFLAGLIAQECAA